MRTQRTAIVAAVPPGAVVVQRVRGPATLTKPHAVALLLIDTIAPMCLTARGWADPRRPDSVADDAWRLRVAAKTQVTAMGIDLDIGA